MKFLYKRPTKQKISPQVIIEPTTTKKRKVIKFLKFEILFNKTFEIIKITILN